MHVPVTSVQLSRGKAESQLLFEITLAMQLRGSQIVVNRCLVVR